MKRSKNGFPRKSDIIENATRALIMQARERIKLILYTFGGFIGATAAVCAAFFGLAVILIILVEYSGPFDCILEIDRSVRSPDQKFAAVVYMSRCGIFASDTTRVSIDPRTRQFTPAKSTPFFVIKDDPDFVVRWTDERTIEIVVPQDRRVYTQEQATDGIKVNYK